ncbi:hypothetical protein [Roseovarius aestuariivivens]|uniref:hypothetical protein n=1 Tax=Roseovarius aestuariivivens TaxID=1888910 RepID=UPI001081E907|nr:hypothetical protein [Roseovarius aestuariivivens]
MLAACHLPTVTCAALFAVAGCSRDSEAEMRARLAPWFALGETLAFQANGGCAAEAFRLIHDGIGSGLSVQSSVSAWMRDVARRGVGALDVPKMTPDAAMVASANAARATGTAMRRTSLEARDCMHDRIGTEFLRLLTAEGIVIGFDANEAAVMLMDRRNAVLVVAMGARP